MTPSHRKRPDQTPGSRPGRSERQPDLLARLSKLNPTVVVLATVGLFLGVLLLPDPVGAALVLAIVAALVWLLTQTWRVLLPGARVMRLLVIGLLLVVAWLKLSG